MPLGRWAALNASHFVPRWCCARLCSPHLCCLMHRECCFRLSAFPFVATPYSTPSGHVTLCSETPSCKLSFIFCFFCFHLILIAESSRAFTMVITNSFWRSRMWVCTVNIAPFLVIISAYGRSIWQQRLIRSHPSMLSQAFGFGSSSAAHWYPFPRNIWLPVTRPFGCLEQSTRL
jgi:hypothetical protein